MQNIIISAVRTLHIISFIVLILGFLTISLNKAWCNSEQILQEDVTEAVLQIIITNGVSIGRGTGFVVEGDTLVTNFHVFEHVYQDGIRGQLRIENTKGEGFYIEGVRGVT